MRYDSFVKNNIQVQIYNRKKKDLTNTLKQPYFRTELLILDHCDQGDRMCPYYLKSLWRYADGDLNALVYDTTLKVA